MLINPMKYFALTSPILLCFSDGGSLLYCDGSAVLGNQLHDGCFRSSAYVGACFVRSRRSYRWVRFFEYIVNIFCLQLFASGPTSGVFFGGYCIDVLGGYKGATQRVTALELCSIFGWLHHFHVLICKITWLLFCAS
jgi:hypothetical protein